MSCEGAEDFRIVIVLCCVWGKDTSFDQTHIQHAKNKADVGRGYKVDSCFKKLYLWDMADSIPYLLPIQF
jgi:hypothetical protein